MKSLADKIIHFIKTRKGLSIGIGVFLFLALVGSMQKREPVSESGSSTANDRAVVISEESRTESPDKHLATVPPSVSSQEIVVAVQTTEVSLTTASTEPPTTSAPTTAAPTEPPTTTAPTTAAPTEASTTPVSTTAAPTEAPTEPPSTPAPTTAAPTEPPTTPAPTTAAPTEASTTPVPTAAAPTEAPTTPAPTTAAPMEAPTEPPTTPAPTTAAPTEPPTTTVQDNPQQTVHTFYIGDSNIAFRRNETAQIVFQGKPNTEYSIEVWYKSKATAEGLVPKVSNSTGVVSWIWAIGPSTSYSTTHKIIISGGGERIEQVFSVVEN